MATATATKPAQKLSVEEELEMIKTAPITEVAAYFGGDLDMVVQLRVDSAVEDTYEKVAARQGVIAEDIYSRWAAEQNALLPQMQVKVRPIEQKGNLHGFASVTVMGITVHDFKIVENKDGELFVSMPSKPDKESESGYRNTVFVEKGYKSAFDDAVIRQFYAVREQVKSIAPKEQAAQNKPLRVAEQMAKATKEAAKQNADRPSPEKGKKTVAHNDR
jgi:DNA-binding cell septation regulator SpoVG